MIISLLPTTALAAEENDVWSTAYDEIRVYMDDATKADHENLKGILPKQVRLYTSKALLDEYVLCTSEGSYWKYSNRLNLSKYKVTAKDITSIDLARDKAIGHSPTISIPIEGNTKYKVTVSQEHQKGNIILGIEVGSYDYLRIDITKREPHTVTYKFSGPAPENVPVPKDPATYTETSPVTLLDPDKTSVTGTRNGQEGLWTFNGWTVKGDQTNTQISQADKKFIMTDEDVTVTGTWTFTSDPTPVYVYFKTVNTKNELVKVESGVTYNANGSSWATLGKLVTATTVTPEKKNILGAEVKTSSNFVKHDSNKDFNLDWISEWVDLKQDNGAADYVKPGTNAWHLDGKVTAYRAIYCDSDGTELKGFAPNTDPKYYLEGTDDVALTKEVPVVPGKMFDGWVTNDVTVENNAFNMPGKDVTFTAKWKPGALKIEKILDDNSPAAEKTFSFTVTPGVEPVQIKGKGSKTISDLPVGSYTVTENSSTAAVDGYRCTTQYKTAGSTWQDTPIPVSVASNSTVTVYVKNSYTPITADLIDNAITIYHQVNSKADWHGEDIGANMTYNYTDTNAHPVPKAADAKISYKAVLDMSYLDFGSNPQNRTAVDTIKAMGQGRSIWEYMQSAEIAMFAGSEVNLHVKFDEKLNVTKGSFDSIELASDWFRLADGYQNGLTKDSNGYWTIPCVIKDVKGTNNSPIITLSGITLSLTDKAQGKLNSNTALDIISEGYIDGTIMIPMQALKLEGKSKEAPAKNTAKLKLAVPTYTVTYDGNGADSGKTTDLTAYATGAKATVKENNYTRGGYTFTGWNTKADGSGTPYKTGDWITMTGSVILYAQWTRNSSHGGDDDDKYFFAIQKVDAQDGHALNGAKFELYQLDKNDRIVNRRVVETRQQSSKNGIALFGVDNKNSYDGIWYYAEVSAPEGYVLDNTEHKIKATDFSDSLSTAVKYADTVRNYRGTTPDLLNDSDHFAYVIGYMDGNVRPYGLISRAETTTIFFRLLKDSVRDGNLLTSNTYTDVADDYWANTAISTMTGLGIVQGRSTTTFDPKAPITRAQFAAICARFDTGKSNGEQTFSDISGHWAEKYIQRAAELGWIKGFEDGTFRPDTYITRAQAMTMINRVLNRIPEDESDLLPGMNVWPDCNPGDWFYLAVQEATNSHDFEHKAGNYETWTKLMKNPDWTRYEN